jgi:hypothetical protein
MRGDLRGGLGGSRRGHETHGGAGQSGGGQDTGSAAHAGDSFGGFLRGTPVVPPRAHDSPPGPGSRAAGPHSCHRHRRAGDRRRLSRATRPAPAADRGRTRQPAPSRRNGGHHRIGPGPPPPVAGRRDTFTAPCVRREGAEAFGPAASGTPVPVRVDGTSPVRAPLTARPPCAGLTPVRGVARPASSSAGQRDGPDLPSHRPCRACPVREPALPVSGRFGHSPRSAYAASRITWSRSRLQQRLIRRETCIWEMPSRSAMLLWVMSSKNRM